MKTRCRTGPLSKKDFCLVFSHQGGNKKIGSWIQFYSGQKLAFEHTWNISKVRATCLVFKSWAATCTLAPWEWTYLDCGSVCSVIASTSDLSELLPQLNEAHVVGEMKHFNSSENRNLIQTTMTSRLKEYFSGFFIIIICCFFMKDTILIY